MEKEIICRTYLPRDWPEIDTIWQLTGLGDKERGDTKDVVEKTLAMGGRMFVLENLFEHRIVGTSWITFDGRRLHLHHFAIHPDYQGRKLSHPLLQATLSFARKNGSQIKLEVHRDNTRAINLYTQYGFKYLGDYDVYIIRKYGRKFA